MIGGYKREQSNSAIPTPAFVKTYVRTYVLIFDLKPAVNIENSTEEDTQSDSLHINAGWKSTILLRKNMYVHSSDAKLVVNIGDYAETDTKSNNMHVSTEWEHIILLRENTYAFSIQSLQLVLKILLKRLHVAIICISALNGNARLRCLKTRTYVRIFGLKLTISTENSADEITECNNTHVGTEWKCTILLLENVHVRTCTFLTQSLQLILKILLKRLRNPVICLSKLNGNTQFHYLKMRTYVRVFNLKLVVNVEDFVEEATQCNNLNFSTEWKYTILQSENTYIRTYVFLIQGLQLILRILPKRLHNEIIYILTPNRNTQLYCLKTHKYVRVSKPKLAINIEGYAETDTQSNNAHVNNGWKCIILPSKNTYVRVFNRGGKVTVKKEVLAKGPQRIIEIQRLEGWQ